MPGKRSKRRRRRVGGRGTGRLRRDRQRQLLVFLVLSVLFLLCLLFDCSRRGLFHRRKESGFERRRESGKETGGVSQRDEKAIRVLVTDSAMASIFHEEVILTASREFQVVFGDKKSVYKAGKSVRLTRSDVKAAGKRVKFSCPQGKIKVSSIRRRGEIPAYRGEITVKWTGQGLLLVNELSLSDYLCAVVPGEMSPDYPPEALKAQAVCARSFAWKQMKSERYKQYGADVDDTTSFQVYNMAGEDKRTTKAVRETRGQMLFDGKEVLTAYYYSTSWGCSATTGEVWGGDDNSHYPRKIQITEKSSRETGISSLNLSDEKVFESFITQDLCDTYDRESGWYRWSVTLPAKQLGDRYGIGRVTRIQVKKREKSGILSQVCLVGKKGRRTFDGQQNIREGLMLSESSVTLKDGSSTTLSLLPSAAFFVQAGVSGGKACFVLRGGGFGHGTGMSQCGAAEMAREGKEYREILHHYYGDCDIK